MPALFSIYDPQGEVFEVPAHKLSSLKKLGWSTSAPVAATIDTTTAKTKTSTKTTAAAETSTITTTETATTAEAVTTEVAATEKAN